MDLSSTHKAASVGVYALAAIAYTGILAAANWCKQIDPNAMFVALIAGLPAIIAAIAGLRNRHHLKQQDRQFEHRTRHILQDQQNKAADVVEALGGDPKKVSPPGTTTQQLNP